MKISSYLFYRILPFRNVAIQALIDVIRIRNTYFKRWERGKRGDWKRREGAKKGKIFRLQNANDGRAFCMLAL